MDERKNQGFAYRLGYRLGRLQGTCRRIETTLVRWFQKKSIPPMATRSVCWIVNLAVAGLLLYLAFWVALFVLGALAIAAAAAMAPDHDDASEPMASFDSEGLCPDPDSLEYMNDPRFDHDL
ncbi:DUF3742 family protein [Pseudomonas batumici]|uniref:DUF3742 family protein n=1 Tax=Pseudomonas batumici TaxID=226910 RepID=UPI000693E5FD|nr:DUF3742 family protein [Pseudomonas batumici]